MGGREAFAVRCAAGEGNRSGEVARNAPGAGGMLNGALHPSDCPGGERGLRLQTVIGGRTRSLCRASRSRKSEGYARRCFASPAHPSSRPCGRNPRRRRARLAASDRHWWTDAEPLSCVAQSGKRIIAVEPPGARRARVVRCIRPIARAASTVCASGRPQWTDAKTFREPRSRKSEGYARRCFTSPAHPSSCPCGRNPWRRARLTASDRQWWTDAELFPCIAQPGKRIIAVELPGTRRARVVRCIRPIARAASTVCASGRHWWTDAEPLLCVAQPGKRIVAVEPPGTRRARVVCEAVRCIRPIARAGSTACGFRPFSMDGREAFP